MIQDLGRDYVWPDGQEKPLTDSANMSDGLDVAAPLLQQKKNGLRLKSGVN